MTEICAAAYGRPEEWHTASFGGEEAKKGDAWAKPWVSAGLMGGAGPWGGRSLSRAGSRKPSGGAGPELQVPASGVTA